MGSEHGTREEAGAFLSAKIPKFHLNKLLFAYLRKGKTVRSPSGHSKEPEPAGMVRICPRSSLALQRQKLVGSASAHWGRLVSFLKFLEVQQFAGKPNWTKAAGMANTSPPPPYGTHAARGPPPAYGAFGANTSARHGVPPVTGSAVLEASMSRIRVSNMRDQNVLRELGKELTLIDESNRSVFNIRKKEIAARPVMFFGDIQLHRTEACVRQHCRHQMKTGIAEWMSNNDFSAQQTQIIQKQQIAVIHSLCCAPSLIYLCNCRHDMELLADYYAIIRTMEKLEKAYIGGHVGDNVYEKVPHPSMSYMYHTALWQSQRVIMCRIHQQTAPIINQIALNFPLHRSLRIRPQSEISGFCMPGVPKIDTSIRNAERRSSSRNAGTNF
jgi:hypothetical protein